VARTDLPSIYQDADIFCFPTLCDTYGIALLEAMSCGCAAIATDVAGAGEIISGENALKVPLQNPEQYIAEFSDSIVVLARNRQRRSQIGEAARKYILEEHDWKRIGDQLLRIYEEFVNEHPRH
jgi:glycosyltransferase involved in cell wall biosynthesis